MVFRSPNKRYVVKIPRRDRGFRDNSREARMWKRGIEFPRSQLARCRLHKSGILVMEYVEPNYKEAERHSWTNWIDCRQVGLKSQGKSRGLRLRPLMGEEKYQEAVDLFNEIEDYSIIVDEREVEE